MKEGECLPTSECDCPGHNFPGVSHMVACCDKPHIMEEEYTRWADVVERNKQVYLEEAYKALDILQVNRHRSCEPYDWFGPDAEIGPPGPNCVCAGCQVRLKLPD